MNQFSVISASDLAQFLAVVLSALVSLLTLYNAARLKSGILAVATYAFGAGMLALTIGFLFLARTQWGDPETRSLIYFSSFVLGFILLGVGSYKIYTMSKV